MSHMWLYDRGSLRQLSEQPEWIEQSVNVFTAQFTCNADKEKLVDVVMALYSFCIACGRYKEGGVALTTQDDTNQLWLSALIDRNRKHIFPPEWFGDSIEILEAEIEKAIEGKQSAIFSEMSYHKLLHARQELCRLHGADLPDHIATKFASKIAALPSRQTLLLSKERFSKERFSKERFSKERFSKERFSKELSSTDSAIDLPTPMEKDIVDDFCVEEGLCINTAHPASGSRRGDRVLPNMPAIP